MPKKASNPARIEWKFQGGQKIGPGGAPAALTKLKESISSNGHTRYTTALWSDGIYSCDCPGWCIAKAGQDRICKHIRASIKCGNNDMALPDDFATGNTEPVKRSQVVIPQRHFRGVRVMPRDS